MQTTVTTDKSGRALFLVSGAAVVALAALFMHGVSVGVPGQWVWKPTRPMLNPRFVFIAIGAGTAFVVLAAVTARSRWEEMARGKRALWLALIVLVVFAMQVALLNSVGVPWASPGAVVCSPTVTAYFGVSLDVKDIPAWLARYHDAVAALPYHARTHPPGMVLFFSLVRRITAVIVPDSSAYWSSLARGYEFFGVALTAADAAAAVAGAFLIALLGALGLVPIYALAAELASPRVALHATLLAGTIPALLMFGASPDLPLFTLTATTVWLAYRAWRTMRPLPALFSGLAFALGTFVSYGLAVVAGWVVVLVAVGLLRRSDRKAALRQFAPVAAAGVAGFVVPYTVLLFALGYHPLAAMGPALAEHRGVTTARSYADWLPMNLVEFSVFAGLPLVLAAMWSVRELCRQGEFPHLNMFLVASAASFALLDLSGSVRGEVGRIWLFLMWPLAMAAAPGLSRRDRLSPFLGLLMLQLMQALIMRSYLRLYGLL